MNVYVQVTSIDLVPKCVTENILFAPMMAMAIGLVLEYAGLVVKRYVRSQK
jgi:hypothetical protein